MTDWRTMAAGRILVRLLALLVVVFSLPIVTLAIVDAVRQPSTRGDLVCSNCGPVDSAPIAVFVGRPQARAGSHVTFRIDSVTSGNWTSGAPIDAHNDDFAPWRTYRVEVYARGDTAYISKFTPPQTLGLAVPTGLRAFNALPIYDWLALVLFPLLVLALVLLVNGSRAQARRERDGLYTTGVGPVQRRVRRVRPQPPRRSLTSSG